MRWKLSLGAAAVVLVGTLVGMNLSGAPAPPAGPPVQVGRFVWNDSTLIRTNPAGKRVSERKPILLDTGTGRVWMLEEDAGGKGPTHKWVLMAEAPR